MQPGPYGEQLRASPVASDSETLSPCESDSVSEGLVKSEEILLLARDKLRLVQPHLEPEKSKSHHWDVTVVTFIIGLGHCPATLARKLQGLPGTEVFLFVEGTMLQRLS
jgi:hypothetical protein